MSFALGARDGYEQLFRAALIAARADEFLQLTVWGADALSALQVVAGDSGTAIERQTHQHPTKPETFEVARFSISSTAAITVHLP